MEPLPHSRRQCERLGQMVLRLRCGRRLRLPDHPPLEYIAHVQIPFPDSHVRTESDPDLPGRNFHILTENTAFIAIQTCDSNASGSRIVHAHPPFRKEHTGIMKVPTASKKEAAQSKIKFRRPKRIRYKRIQPPRRILHTSLNTRKSSPFFASDRNRSGPILRIQSPQFRPSENVLHQQRENDRTEKHRTDSIKEARSKLLRASYFLEFSL